MTKIIRKLYVEPETTEWVGQITPQVTSSVPEIFIQEIMFDGDITDIAYDDELSDDDILDLLEERYFSDPVYVRPSFIADLEEIQDKVELLSKLQATVNSLKQFRQEFSDNSGIQNSDTYSRFFNFGESSVLPGFIPYRDSSLVIRRKDYDSVDSAMEAAIGVLGNYSSSRPESFPKLTATVVPLSKSRDQINTTTMFPGDIFKLLLKGGAGLVSKALTGISKYTSAPNVYKVTGTTPTTAEQTLSDGNTTVTININITLPSNSTDPVNGEEEEV